MKQYKLDIILPTYHEENNIEEVVGHIKKNVKTPHVITVVIQEKDDPTLKVLNKLKGSMTNLRIIFTKDGKGLLKALKAGFENSQSPIIAVTMADLSDDSTDIDKMVEKIDEGYDLVCGSRYMKGGKHLGGPKIKGLLSYTACKSLKILTGVPTNDATNAFKCFRRSVLDKINLESMEGFELPLELTVKAFAKGLKIGELPTIWRDRESGFSKFDIGGNMKYYMRWYLWGLWYCSHMRSRPS